ncbi:MAG: methylenetetrahydrofolate reductase, partial [Proteobacteria bacterium]
REPRFTWSAEILPADEKHDLSAVLDQCRKLKDQGVDFFSIADGPAGSPRGGTAELTDLLRKEFQTLAVPHLITRDRTAEKLSEFIEDYAKRGVRNILALRGDPPNDLAEGTEWNPREKGDYTFAYELIKQIAQERPEISIGAACYPDRPNLEKEAAYLKSKQDAGARFAITQLILSVDSYRAFVEAARKADVTMPILPGVLVPHSEEHAQQIAQRFGTRLDPKSIVGVNETLADFAQKLKAAGAPGVHLYVLRSADVSIRTVR